MSRIVAPVLIITSLALVAADKKEPDPEPKTKAPPKADVRGEVKSIGRLRNLVTRLLIEGKKEKDTGYDRAYVSIPVNLKIYSWKDGKKVAAKVADIKVGSRVQCVFDGAVDQSLPVQARAKEVLILPPAKAKK